MVTIALCFTHIRYITISPLSYPPHPLVMSCCYCSSCVQTCPHNLVHCLSWLKCPDAWMGWGWRRGGGSRSQYTCYDLSMASVIKSVEMLLWSKLFHYLSIDKPKVPLTLALWNYITLPRQMRPLALNKPLLNQ